MEGRLNYTVFKKGDQFDKNNFRPLTILIAINKVLEKCLHWQLSPCGCVIGCVIGVIFMGLRKAFHSLTHNLLLAKFKDCSACGETLKFTW